VSSKREIQQPPNYDELVPDREVAKECGGVTLMTLWRWSNDPKYKDLNFPPPIKLKTRNYRSRRQLEEFKQRKFLEAIATRSKVKPPPPDGCLGTAVLSEAKGESGRRVNSTARPNAQAQEKPPALRGDKCNAGEKQKKMEEKSTASRRKHGTERKYSPSERYGQ
jgi:predicted DNA-binding transcriptional regulator AlpA